MIKILHFVPFGGGAQGGIESFIMNIYRLIDRSKLQFDFLTYGDPAFFIDEITMLGGKVFCLTSRRDNPIKYYNETKKFFEMYGDTYKFLHMHICSASNILPMKLNRTIPYVIIHSHLSATLGGIATCLHKINQRYILKHAYALWACSDLAAKHMYGENYENDERYKFIPNAIDIEKYNFNKDIYINYRRQLNISEDDIILGFVGRLVKVKNVEYLIDIIYRLCKINSHFKLMIIGDGPSRKDIEKKIKDLNLERNVLLLGARNDVDMLLQSMDMFISASYVEGLPVSVIEAQAAGLKCIVSSEITRQVNICGMVAFISRLSGLDVWVNHILKYKTYNREEHKEEIDCSPFNIHSLLAILENYYLQ